MVNTEDKDNSRQSQLFVGGAPRSGTTLVQNMLDSHPDIYGGPEFLHLPDLIELRNEMHNSVKRGYIDLYCSCEEVDDEIRSLFNSFVGTVEGGKSAAIISEKTPENVLVFTDLLEVFPNARLIHVVRDPRAVVASMLRVGRRAKEKGMQMDTYTRSTRAAIDHTQKCVSAGLAANAREPDRVLTVIYENLVRSPERETRRMCDFLNASWSEEMLTPASQDHAGEAAITKEQVYYTEDEFNKNPYTDRISRWRQELSSRQQVRVTKAFSTYSELEELGYDLSVSNLSGAKRVLGGVTHGMEVAAISVLSPLKPVLRRMRSIIA